MIKMSKRKDLHRIATEAPSRSGVYFWKDEDGKIIYVGKAKSLKNRLLSYFAKTKDVKTRILVARARELDYIETKTEYEALLLENTLIKKYKPKYNISLKDGKTYPVIKITNEKFPVVFRTRTLKNDGAFYFGPFPNVYAVDNFLHLIKQNYKLRQCKVLRKRKYPCLYYHIEKCTAPCCEKISAEDYNKEINEVKNLLTNAKSLDALEKQMQEAAMALDFEKAKRLRDGIQSILALHNQNVVEDLDANSRDYIAWASEGAMISFTVLKMRQGKLVGRDLYQTQSLKSDSEVVQEFLPMYYKDKKEVPPTIFILAADNSNEENDYSNNVNYNDNDLINNWFKNKLSSDAKIISLPILLKQNYSEKKIDGNSYVAEETKTYFADELRKTISVSADDENLANDFKMQLKDFRHHRAALSMAYFNAREDLSRRLREYGDWAGLEELKKVLNLKVLPARIEGFDIAHLDGQDTVASMVSFKDGNPDKKNYRIFKLRTTEGIVDDYASIKEVVARRYTRVLNEDGELPDLILVDGGLGQVNAAFKILSALKLNIPLVGLAERNEEIFFPNNSKPLILARKSSALRLLQRVRDEAHRFATSKNKQRREKKNLQMSFEVLPNVGKKRAKLLLENFGSLKKLSVASEEEIIKALKVSKKIAREISLATKNLIEK
ncbi:MAG: excinuclease ABC subunit UvrC [Treponemataceae bacterium]